MREGNATVLSLALLLFLAVLTPPVPFSLRGLIQIYAFQSELAMPEPKIEDTCPISGISIGTCNLTSSASSSLTHDPLREESEMPEPEKKKKLVGKEYVAKEHLTFDEARQQFSPRVELHAKKDDKADSTNFFPALGSSDSSPATRRLLITVASGAGTSLLLTMMVVGTFMCSALGVIGLMVTMLACGLVMCVFTCAFFSFCCGLGISILVGVSIAAAVLSFQLCLYSLDAVQSVARCASGG